MKASPDGLNSIAGNEPDSWSANPHSQKRPEDRRQDDRIVSVFRPALVEIEGLAGFCLVRNLSPNGMMASVHAQFAPDQPATVQFSDEIAVPGRIAWSEDERIGVEFEREIDVDAVLCEQASTCRGKKIKRAPRLPVNCSGELILENGAWLVRILDISQRGIKAAGASLLVGDQVVVRLPEMEPRKAVVRWAHCGTMGLNFLSPIGFRELAEWVT